MAPLLIKNTITIDAPAEKVWDALVNPEQTKQYMFGCETVSDWKPGSDLLWQMDYEGKELVAVKGKVVRIDAPHRLDYTVIDPNSATVPDVPENYLTVTYELNEANSKTTLHVTQGDYNAVADGAKRYQESYNNGEGWYPLLAQIKAQVEGQQ